MNIQRSRLLPHIPYLRSQGAGCLIYIYIDLYVPPACSVQESGRKRDSRGGREPEVDDLRN